MMLEDAFSFVKEHKKNRLLTHRVSRRFLCDFGNLSITYSYRRQPG